MRFLTTIVLACACIGCTSKYISEPNFDSDHDNEIPSWGIPDSLEYWAAQVFDGETRYQVVSSENGPVLEAKTDGTASALYLHQTFQLVDQFELVWSWWVSNIYSGVNHLEKSGDDYPVRLYVIHQDSLSPLDAKAINYVWASSDPGLTHWANPYNQNSIMIPLRTGSEEAAQWRTERRDVGEDFKTHFGLDISEIHAVAVMSDSDDTGQNAIGKFGDIIFTQE